MSDPCVVKLPAFEFAPISAGMATNTLMDDLATQITAGAMRGKENVIRRVIDSTLGDGQWELRDMKGRATLTKYPNGNEIFSLDGRELVEFFPHEFSMKDWKMAFTQRYRLLANPVNK